MIVAIVIAVTIIGLTYWLIARGRGEYRQISTSLRAINQLSVDEAKARALKILGSSAAIRTEAGEGALSLPRPVPPTIEEFLRTYSHIAGYGADISRDAVGVSDNDPTLTRIGRGMEGSDTEYELCVRSSSDVVYEVHRGESPDPSFGTYQSIYHWILAGNAGLL